MIRLRDAGKHYDLGQTRISALHGVSLDIDAGEFVAVVGPSGSGKSTLMNVIGCLDKPDSGSYTFKGIEISQASEDDLAAIRNRHIGFVFQSYNLIPRLSAEKNAELPMVYAGLPADLRRQRARAALKAVGLGDRLDHTPSKLSGGQQQRVALARALVNNPSLIIADEPTGALDSATAHEVMGLFRQLNAGGKTIVLVTHEADIAAYAKRVIQLKDGRVVADQSQ